MTNLIYIVNIFLIIAIAKSALRKSNYVSLAIFLLPVGFNYTAVLFAALANIELQSFENEVKTLHNCILAWCIGFALQSKKISLFSRRNVQNKTFSSEHIIRQNNSWAFLPATITSLIIIINNLSNYQTILSGGYHAVYTKESDLLVRSTTILPLYLWLNLILLSLKNNKIISGERENKLVNIAVTIYYVSIASFILSGSRSTIVYMIITILCVIYSGKFYSKVRFATLGASALIIIASIGSIRESGEINFDNGVMGRVVAELGQTTLVFFNSIQIIEPNANRYIELLTTVAPQTVMKFIGVTPPISLAQTYAETLDPGWAASGGGFGFSIFAEMYISGGLPMVFIMATLIAKFCNLFHFVLIRREIFAVASCATVLFYLCTIARGEIYDLYRPIIFSTVVYYLSKLKYQVKPK